MFNAILCIFRVTLMVLAGSEQIALENLALRPAHGNLPTNGSPSQDPIHGSSVLDLLAENVEGLEVGSGDCPTRNRSRLAAEAFQTLLVAVVAAHESRPTSDRLRYSKACQNDGRGQSGLGRSENSWRTAQARSRGIGTYRFPTDAEAIQGAIADVANLLGQSRSRFGVDRLLYRTDCETARVVCVHCFLS